MMNVPSRLLTCLSFTAATCFAVAPAHAVLQTGSFSFDGQTVHYLAFVGKDPAFFQSFTSGGTLINFETLPSGVTPFTTSNYNNGPVAANNFMSPRTQPINGIFFSSGGQTPGDPMGSAAAAPTIPVTLNGIAGAHSPTNVLAVTNFDNLPDFTDVKFSGGFQSFGVQAAGAGNSGNLLSRIGFFSNPLMSAPATTPNVHLRHSDGSDASNFLADPSGLNFTTKMQGGDFFAVAFDKPIIQEIEFVPVDHGTIDDVVYARDNSIAFVPEPQTWAIFIGGALLLGLLRIWKSATP